MRELLAAMPDRDDCSIDELAEFGEKCMGELPQLWGDVEETFHRLEDEKAKLEKAKATLTTLASRLQKELAEVSFERSQLKLGRLLSANKLQGEVDSLKDAGRAYRELATCYRLGKNPSEALWKRIGKAREVHLGT